MQIARLKIQHFWPVILLIVPVLGWMLGFSSAATAFDFHADSAHGNNDPAPGYGVNRSAVDYPTGDCAHCHDTFDPTVCGVNETILFVLPNDETLCFQCHKGAGSVQEGGITNYNYGGEKFGGGPNDFSNVYDAFGADASGGSSHDPAALLAWAETNHPEWGFTASSNSCTICHNPHKDKANWRYPQDPTYTAVRRPSEHASTPGNLWGDDTGETMDSTWSAYQAPYYQGGNYEPGGTTSTDGSKHPDYSTLCLDCHSVSVNGLDAVNWTQATSNDWVGGIHGEEWFSFHPTFGDVKAPYPLNTDYVLSCLDCHEPHGSSNPRTLRTTVNGVSGLTYELSNNALIETWCGACHEYDPAYSPMHFGFREGYCTGGPGQDDCHTHGGDYPL